MKRLFIILCWLIGSVFSQTHNTIERIYQFPDSTAWYWRMWHVNTAGQVITQHTVDKNTPLTSENWGAGPPPFCLWAFNVANWPLPQWQPGDRLIMQADYDSAYGSKAHKGFYAINNDTLRGDQNPQYFLSDTLRAIPRPNPVVWDSSHNDTVYISANIVNLVWKRPVQNQGIPLTNNIIGYALYRDITGTGEDDTLANGSLQYFSLRKIVTDTVCQDTITGLEGHFIYYVIKLVYRPDTTPKFMSKFCSANSRVIYKTSMIGIKETRSQELTQAKLSVYPNPFDEQIYISYTMPEQKFKNYLNIYDATGKLVRSFKNLNSGQSTLVWKGDDESGTSLGGGVFFIELRSPDNTLIKKVILHR